MAGIERNTYPETATSSRPNELDDATATVNPPTVTDHQREAQPSKTTTPDPSQYLPVKNPRATLMGLPAELRLIIYSFASENNMIHVHCRESKHVHRRESIHVYRRESIYPPEDSEDDDCRFPPKEYIFTWTPCKGVNPNNPLLCANPKWSPLCEEKKDRCKYDIDAPPTPVGFWALAASCKFIHGECQEFFMSGAVYPIKSELLKLWLHHMEKYCPKQLKMLKKVTLHRRKSGLWPWNDLEIHLEILKKKIPELKALGLQYMAPSWGPHGIKLLDSLKNKRNLGYEKQCTLLPVIERAQFEPHINIAVEATMVLGPWELYFNRMNIDILETSSARYHAVIVRFSHNGRVTEDTAGKGVALDWCGPDYTWGPIRSDPRRYWHRYYESRDCPFV